MEKSTGLAVIEILSCIQKKLQLYNITCGCAPSFQDPVFEGQKNIMKLFADLNLKIKKKT